MSSEREKFAIWFPLLTCTEVSTSFFIYALNIFAIKGLFIDLFLYSHSKSSTLFSLSIEIELEDLENGITCFYICSLLPNFGSSARIFIISGDLSEDFLII
ncbi:hypothetical protein L6452_42668 [Arctium lappa]|uniref:Uncharacterized protein n=1 Tax=Arctium lappa TaxID=4217 RepID=A0ACB8XJ40_ARCLA|nr:hypothetical protein L6452_42668 [Arctium lappa]